MAEINVTFIHPTNGGSNSAEIEDQLTVDELINLLVEEGFVQGDASEIELLLIGKSEKIKLQRGNTLVDSGVVAGSQIRVTIAPVAGNQKRG